MKSLKAYIAIVVAVLLQASAVSAKADGLVDFAPAKRFIEVDAHAIGGVGSILQNYRKEFSQIQNLNINMGASVGAGFRAVFGIREFLGFGTAIDLMYNRYNIDMAILGTDGMSMSSVFIDNDTYSVNIPVFVSFRFKVDKSVRWSVDIGGYYAFGFAGTQKQRIYRADINGMEEIVPQMIDLKTDYFHSGSTFINGFNRGDLGVHLATFVNFGPHLLVGARYQIGAKNISRPIGVVNPSIHNHYFQGIIGYRF